MKSGDVVGRLTLLTRGYSPKNKGMYWVCQCSCGTKLKVWGTNLARPHTLSCGCLNKELAAKRQLTHGGSVKGHREPLYRVWLGIKERCKDHPDYKGRHIQICSEWSNDYACFRRWALANGYQKGLSIERLNNDDSYSPDNCCFATPTAQAQNRRTSFRITAFGETKVLMAWSRDSRCEVSWSTFRYRILKGIAPEIAMKRYIR